MNYFGEAEEAAVIEYNQATSSVERNVIYETKLHKPMLKLAECVLHRHRFPYYLNECGSDQNTIQTGLTYLVCLLPKVNQQRGKSFSFLTYCLKNYYIQLNNEAYKKSLKEDSIEEFTNDNGEYFFADSTFDSTAKEYLKQLAVSLETDRHTLCRQPIHQQMLTVIIEGIQDAQNTEQHKHTIFKDVRGKLKLGPDNFKFIGFIKRLKAYHKIKYSEYIENGTL